MNKIRGYSLLEMMVAIGLSTIVGTIVIYLFNNIAENKRRADLLLTLSEKKLYFQNILSNEQAFKNTVAASININMQCMRDSVLCSTAYVASAYSNSQDRVVLYDNSPAPGRIIYDARPSSASGFTEGGVPCIGFSATGPGNDACPIGYIMTWYLDTPGGYQGVILHINGKLIYNPTDSNKMKKTLNAVFSNELLGAYDFTSVHNVFSQQNLSVPVCTLNGVTLYNSGSYVFYHAPSVPLGSACSSESRVCSIANNIPLLSGSFTYTSCLQHCYGTWGPCTAGLETYTVSIEAQGGGNACTTASGATRSCP